MAISPGPHSTAGFSMQYESIPQWVKKPPSPESRNDPLLDENRGWNILMTINTALVGAFGINWLHSQGDRALSFKCLGRGFESH